MFFWIYLQTLLVSESEAGARYVVDAKVTNHAVPLCNCFHVVNRYCLLRVNRTTSHMYVCSMVVHEKPLFFGAKSLIESSCRSGLSDFFDNLTTQLTESVNNLSNEDRLTGGILASCRNGLPNPNNNSLNFGTNPINRAEIKSKKKLLSLAMTSPSTNGGPTQRKPNSSNLADSSKEFQYFKQNPAPCGANADKPNGIGWNSASAYRRFSNAISLFASSEVSQLFTKPDRAWLLLVLVYV